MAITKPKKETKPKKPTTLEEYKAQGWEVGPYVKMSNPPVYTLTKDGKTIQFRPPMKKNPFGKRPMPEKGPDIIRPKKSLRGLGKKGAAALEKYLKKNPVKKKDGGFPDLSGDGKITKKDILMGRGVIKKRKGGKVTGKSIGPAGASIVSDDGKRIKKSKKKKKGFLGIAIDIIRPKTISAAKGGLAGRLAKRGYGKARK